MKVKRLADSDRWGYEKNNKEGKWENQSLKNNTEHKTFVDDLSPTRITEIDLKLQKLLATKT